MQRSHLFSFWNQSIVKWCTLIGCLFLLAHIFIRKFIAHSQLHTLFSLCHIALLNYRNKYWFLIFDPWQGYTPQWVCTKLPNVLHSRRDTSCTSSFRCTEYFRNTSNWWDPHGGSKPVLPELSQTMAYTTHKTVNRLAHKQLHLNHVVSEQPKEE